MSVAGKWNITVNSPMGAQEVVWDVAVTGQTVTGTVTGQQGTTNILNGTWDGESVRFDMNIQNPMPLKLNIKGTVDGDSVSGTVSTMMFGTFPLNGSRATE